MTLEAKMTPTPTPTPTARLDRLLDRARQRLDRLHPVEAAAEVAAGVGLLVDTRPELQRRTDGDVPGAIVAERNHLEWRLHPQSEGAIPEATSLDLRWIVLCDEGYSSSLAAATLQLIGLPRSTDVVGGFSAWRAAGLPVVTGRPLARPRLFRPASR